MKVLTITCKSTDKDYDFQVELDLIMEQIYGGFENGSDTTSLNSFCYRIEYSET